MNNVWMDKFLGNKWSHMNETVAFKTLVCCSTNTDLRQLGILRKSLDVSGSKTPANEVKKRRYHNVCKY
jgi:hypothetical protein